jgi:hypothetical protein
MAAPADMSALLLLLAEQPISVATVLDLANFLTTAAPATPTFTARGEPPPELVDTTL